MTFRFAVGAETTSLASGAWWEEAVRGTRICVDVSGHMFGPCSVLGAVSHTTLERERSARGGGWTQRFWFNRADALANPAGVRLKKTSAARKRERKVRASVDP